MTKLRGQELLEFVRQNPDATEKQLAYGAGYFGVTKTKNEATGEEMEVIQYNTKPFYQELTIAQGLIAPKNMGRSATGRRGKSLAYRLKTNINSGNTVVTGGYLSQIGVVPGDYVDVEVIEEAGELVLKKSETSTPFVAEAFTGEAAPVMGEESPEPVAV